MIIKFFKFEKSFLALCVADKSFHLAGIKVADFGSARTLDLNEVTFYFRKHYISSHNLEDVKNLHLD